MFGEDSDKKRKILAKALYNLMSWYDLYDMYDMSDIFPIMEGYDNMEEVFLNADSDFLLDLAEEIISDYADFGSKDIRLDSVSLNDYKKVKAAYDNFWDIFKSITN